MRTCALLLAGLLAGAAGSAHAQSGYGQGYPASGGYGQGGYGRQPQAAPDDRYDDGQSSSAGSARGSAGYADADQAPPDLGRELRLRPDQQAALRAYQQATTPTDAEQQRAQADYQRLAGLSTPQRLDFTAQQMQRDQADFARRAAAVRRFYAQLTPDQQRRFDQATAPPADDGQGRNDYPGADGAGSGYDRGAPPR